nr:immunoglobulin heavy chain junction region [Mus musculus]
STAYMQLSSLT